MFLRPSNGILVVFIITIIARKSKETAAMTSEFGVSTQSSIWADVSRIFRFILDNCLNKDIKELAQLHRSEKTVMLEKCVKLKGLRKLDKALSRDKIAITDNIALVKRNNDTAFNDTSKRNWAQESFRRARQLSPSWNLVALDKVLTFLESRILRTAFSRFNISTLENEGRHQHKGNDLGQMLMFGLVAAGLIVIPMGFQFLAVLGGKALLLAKLALILTSIQGLKKIATSNMNYGLYSTGHAAAPWPYDRKWFQDGDLYSSNYPPGVDSQITDHYTHSTSLPPAFNNFNPRGGNEENYLVT